MPCIQSDPWGTMGVIGDLRGGEVSDPAGADIKGNGIKMILTNCVICGSEEYDHILTSEDLQLGIPGQFTLVRCSRCGLFYQNPRPESGDIAKYYADEYAPHRSIYNDWLLRFRLWFRSVEIKYYLDYGVYFHTQKDWQAEPQKSLWPLIYMMKKLLAWPAPKRKKGSLVDVGCGNGFFLNSLRNSEWILQGVEISESAARVGREEFELNIFTGSLEEAAFEEGAFDVVVLSHFLEHVYNPLATLTEAARIAKNNGLVVVTVQNIESTNFRIFGDRWCGHDLPRHMYDFSAETFKKLVEKIKGLEVCEVKFMASPIVVFYSLIYELRYRRMSFLWPIIVMTIPLQFLYCWALACVRRSDLITVYLRKCDSR